MTVTSIACAGLQVLVYFAVAKQGDKPIDGKTDVNPEGLTAATGKHAAAVADRLQSGGLSCKVREVLLGWVDTGTLPVHILRQSQQRGNQIIDRPLTTGL